MSSFGEEDHSIWNIVASFTSDAQWPSPSLQSKVPDRWRIMKLTAGAIDALRLMNGQSALGLAWVLIQGGTKKRKASTFGSSKGFESLGTEQRSSGVAVVSRMGLFSSVAESASSRGRPWFVWSYTVVYAHRPML